MCLYIGNKKGHIAVKDIVCFKELILNKGKYETPYQKTKVTPGEYLIPDCSSPRIFKNGFKYIMGGGVIHAYLDLLSCEPGSRSTIFKAIIKKGTRFWIQDDLEQIAAEKLFITKEKVTPQEKFDYNSLIPYASKIKTKGGYKVSLEDVPDYKDILGVYTSKSLVSLNIHYEHLSETKSYKFYDDPEKAIKDYDGSGNTKNLDVKYLGDHEYIPSLGELTEALMETAEMNIVRKILGKEQLIHGWFWSSTMRENKSAWCCSSYGFSGLDYSCPVRLRFFVLPFLNSSHEKYRIKIQLQ